MIVYYLNCITLLFLFLVSFIGSEIGEVRNSLEHQLLSGKAFFFLTIFQLTNSQITMLAGQTTV